MTEPAARPRGPERGGRKWGWEQMQELVLRVLEEHYALGSIREIRRLSKGYVNANYRVRLESDGRERCVLARCYREGKRLERIRFEHALLLALEQRGFSLSPKPVPAPGGETIVTLKGAAGKGEGESRHFAVFTWLEGRDPYAWDDPRWGADDLQAAACALARYHGVIADWRAPEAWCKPRLADEMRALPRRWFRAETDGWDTAFGEVFLACREELLQLLQAAIVPPAVYDALPHLAVHGDYHPGNLKFGRGGVTGVFDFDWANVDSRCFDVALALVYFCASWDGPKDGVLDLDKARSFLAAYQETAAELPSPGVLGRLERIWLPRLAAASNFYVLAWTVADYADTRSFPEAYLRYFRHGVRLARWLGRHGNMPGSWD